MQAHLHADNRVRSSGWTLQLVCGSNFSQRSPMSPQIYHRSRLDHVIEALNLKSHKEIYKLEHANKKKLPGYIKLPLCCKSNDH